MELARRERLFRPADGVDRPPVELAEGRCLAGSGIPVHDGFEGVGPNQIEVLLLAVFAIVPREFTPSGPDLFSRRDPCSTSLLRDLPAKCILIRFTGFQAPTGSNPKLKPGYWLPDLHQQYTAIRRQPSPLVQLFS